MSLITPDFGLIFWMTLIFGIVFFILAKFGFPIITGMVEERNERIAASISEARKAEESLKTLSRQQDEIIDECRRKQAEIIRETSDTRDNMLAQARQQAQDEAAKIIRQAREQIASEKENALREIRAEVVKLSVDVAEKVLRRELSDEQSQIAIVDRMVNEISSTKLN